MSRRAAALVAIASIALVATGCAASTPSTSESSADGGELTHVTIALDWTPNTNHLGLYAAQELGYFEDAGLDVEILPYSEASGVSLLDGGAADFAIVTQSAVLNARASGLDTTSVFGLVQKSTGALIALGDRDDISSPADFDGRIYGGWAPALNDPSISEVIQADGGTGDFEYVVLSTGIYEALESGAIDFTSSIVTWENVNAELEGHPYQVWNLTDYGIPESQTLVVAASQANIDADPETAAAFVGALQDGYEFAISDPEEAAQLLIDANPDFLGNSAELVTASTQLLVDEFFQIGDNPVGYNNPEIWAAQGEYAFEHGALVDATGTALTEAPDWTAFYTNDLLGTD